jgi:hypothetical protein
MELVIGGIYTINKEPYILGKVYNNGYILTSLLDGICYKGKKTFNLTGNTTFSDSFSSFIHNDDQIEFISKSIENLIEEKEKKKKKDVVKKNTNGENDRFDYTTISGRRNFKQLLRSYLSTYSSEIYGLQVDRSYTNIICWLSSADTIIGSIGILPDDVSPIEQELVGETGDSTHGHNIVKLIYPTQRLVERFQ